VHFAYPTRRAVAVLRGFELTVRAGTKVALVGASGCGKSTLVSLLERFYDVDAGAVRLDGVDVRALEPRALRAQLAFVGQEPVLFDGTVAENLRHGAPTATRAQLEAAARVANAADFIERLPRGYDTVIGERGQKLSGGQRQRLSIARAVLKDPPVLVLDEATSAVDNETEAAIQRSLARITRGRTTLMIAHRLSTIVHADRIHVLAGGRIVEQGDHGALIAQGGPYAALWAVQTGLGAPPAAGA
jgi:ATP-binding cassette subfamily B protein